MSVERQQATRQDASESESSAAGIPQAGLSNRLFDLARMISWGTYPAGWEGPAHDTLLDAKTKIETLERQLADSDAAIAWHMSGYGFGAREGHLNGELDARERHRARIASLNKA